MLKLIRRDIDNEKEIIEWLESMKYSESIIIGKIRITKWVQTYEIGTREGNKQNSFSTDNLEKIAKKVVIENKLLIEKETI